MASIALSVVSPLINVTREMYRKISESCLVGKMQNDLLQRISEIEAQLMKMDEDEDITANSKVMEIIDKAHKSLQECHETCTKIANQTWPKQVLYSGSNRATVEDLQKRLGEIHQDLTSTVTIATYQKVSHIKRSMGSQAGVYSITDNVSPPTAVDKPECSIKNDKQIIVKWNKSSSSVQNYEIKLNGKKVTSVPHPNNHYIIESPIFNRKPGIYTLQVRAINEGGPGKWSDEVTVEYKKAPNKPKKPTLDPSYDNVQIVVIIPDIDESNGAAVNKIIVRYNLPTSPNNFQEQTFTIANMTSRYYSATISGLEPCMCYSFQIFLVNDCGRSIPSDPVFAYTMPRPRKPVNLKVFKCTYDSLTIVWDSPDDQQAAKLVEYYQLWYRKKNGNDHYQEYITAVNGIELNNLEPGTEYDFLVIAVNKNGHHSKEARITAKTKESMMYSLNLVATFFNSRFSF